MPTLCASRQQLLSSLKGQQLHIPDLRVIFQHWPQAVSPVLDGLKLDLPEKMMSLTSSSKKLAKMHKAEFALFSASWWPTATLERGKILTCLAMWLFIWDDEIDAEVGRLADDLKASQKFRNETIRYTKFCLGLSDEFCHTPENRIIAFFKVIGDATLEACTFDQRILIQKELEFFMETSETEQERRLSENLPTLDEYITCRMGTSAVGVTSAYNEFAYGLEPLPTHVMEDPEMRTLWDETNIIVWAVNDLLSLKKEIQQQTVDSLLPLLHQKFGQLNISVSLVVEAVEKAVKNFDNTAASLLDNYSADRQITGRLKAFIEASQYNCTGNLGWSLRTGRYGVCQKSIIGGVTVKLE
ncbi:isoprenoid synthase domain-containing protein [Massariosphaeria phaeospora]|uniref:Terpene synthase n=1 Tax=Massariosphaeria phaeospora TaxID=100035 RepID=A0A7C8I5K0_9PLEO|nr:isoprenoid synthase domain-containing protein [Massariosphaeria phaeospora]